MSKPNPSKTNFQSGYNQQQQPETANGSPVMGQKPQKRSPRGEQQPKEQTTTTTAKAAATAMPARSSIRSNVGAEPKEKGPLHVDFAAGNGNGDGNKQQAAEGDKVAAAAAAGEEAADKEDSLEKVGGKHWKLIKQ
jgi:hypothetical protein